MNRPTATHVCSIADPIAAVFLVACVASLWGGHDPPAVAGQPAKANLPADDVLRPERVRALVEEFKRARTPEGREAIVAELLAGGPAAAAKLLTAARGELGRLGPPYAARFQRAAMDVLKDRARARGLPAQAIDPKLVTACRVHSRDMQERGFFDHESPVPGRATPWARAEAAGTSASAENIFSGVDDGRAAIQGWWHSPGHHKNMLGGQQRTGLGRWKQFWTQLFG